MPSNGTVESAPPTPGELTVAPVREDERLTLALEGELDVATVRSVEQHVRDLEGVPVSVLVIDLTRVGFIDSTGLQTLVWIQRRGRAGGFQLILRHPSTQTRKLLQLTGLLDRFRIED